MFKAGCHPSNRNLDDFHYLLFDTNLRGNVMQAEVCSCKCNSAENIHNLYGLHLMLVLPGIYISWIVLIFNPEGLLIKKKKGERFGLSVPIPDVVVQVAED